MLVDEAGERSFVADRGAADLLAAADLRSSWFAGASILHLPAYSLLGSPLGDAARRAIELAREADAAVSVDLASAVPLLAAGRREAHQLIAGAGPDVLFATMAEASAFLGAREPDGLLGFAPIAIVKRGSDGATILARGAGPAGYGRPGVGSAAVPAHVSPHAPVIRLDIATRPLSAADTTGAGDAFDAGFLAAWLAADRSTAPDILRRAVVAGHRAAARQVARPRPELALG
jgi:sugar/nucleoside kinase (ribokinase family)